MRTGAGFSLLELLVVLAVLALVAVIAIPGTGGALTGAALESGARRLAAGLREARSLAVAQNRVVRFTLSGAEKRYFVGAGARGAPLPAKLGIILTTAAPDAGGGESGAIRFFPDGSSTGGRIELTGPAERRSVTVDWLTGRIRQGSDP
jgi:general secretion pathway protein H